jgi:hypothetical protein
VSKGKGKTREEIINNLAERIDKFERYTNPHSQAMADMALHLANRLGLSQADAKAIAEAARLHDIGLYTMSPAYHATSATLRFTERLDLWRHSIIGEQEMAKREASRYAQLLVRWHHEWWNGSGYPDMLAFEDIPIGARILRAVELYNASTSERPYRAALAKKEALEVLKSSAGIECDPYVVYALLALLEEMNAGEAQEATIFPDQAIPTEKLDEIKAEDSIATVRLNQPIINSQSISSSSTDEQTSIGSLQNSPTIHQQPTDRQAKQTPGVQETTPPVEANSSTSVWSSSSEGRSTPSSGVWSVPQEPLTAQGASDEATNTAATDATANSATGEAATNQSSSSNPLVTSRLVAARKESTTLEAHQASAPLETEPKSAINESFFQLANPLDSEDEPQAKSSSTDTPQGEPLSTDAPPVATSSIAAPPVATPSTPPADASPGEVQPIAQASIKHLSLPELRFASESKIIEVDDSPNWLGWKGSVYNKKSLLGFEASVLRQIQFATVAIPFSGEAKLDWYLKAWNKRIISNDARAWAATVARAMIESTEALDEEDIAQLLTDIYVPGTRFGNPHLRRWFSETDAWWMDNLRRNIEALADDKLRAQACLLGLQAGDYALSFTDETRDLRRPLTTVFWRLAGRFTIGAQPHPQNRSYNYQPLDFIRNAHADLLYLNLPASQDENEGAQSRFEWRECWVKGLAADAEDFAQTLPSPQSKKAYLLRVDKLLRAGAHIRKWAVACQEIGLVSAREINELVKEHRAVRATYSKDVSEVAGGSRSYIIVAERE